MRDHLVYGGVLRSPLAWPELREVAAPAAGPDWTLTVGPPEPLPPDAVLLGEHGYPGDVRVGLWSSPRGWRVATSDIGDFDIGDGGALGWCHDGTAREDLARFDLLGRVLPLALHRSGATCLHGSAVALDAGALVLLGGKGRGKSTTALALAQRGGRLLTDDVAVIEPAGDEMVVRPGVHAVRLWEDAASRLGTDAWGRPGSIGRKLVVNDVPDALRATAPSPLAAVYLLDDGVPTEGAVASRRRLPATEAMHRLLGQVTAGALLGGAEQGVLLRRLASVVAAAPVFAVRVDRDFSRLEELAEQVASWMSAVNVTPAGAGAWRPS